MNPNTFESFISRLRLSSIPKTDISKRNPLMDRFTFSSYYDASQHIEKYMHWYNKVRRHGAIGWITPEQKWEQSYSWLPVRPPSAPAFQAAVLNYAFIF